MSTHHGTGTGADQDLYIGVDTGGTFTDIVVMDAEGGVYATKAPTTPDSLDVGVFDALALVAEHRGESVRELLGKVVTFGHGTTQATNALIERRGRLTGLITTEGFGDTLIIQRLMGFTSGVPVERLGDFSERSYPDPIVPRELIAEVPERIDHAGQVVVPLDEDAVRAEIRRLTEADVSSFAVCLLWSFRNPVHEQRVGELIAEIAGPSAYISLSSEVNPVLGEYERTATTVLNSYLGPVVERYLESLEARLRAEGLAGRFSVLNSIGGVMNARDAAQRGVLLLGSGPTGGVLGSHHLAAQLGHRNIITSDMGGTSFDVGLVVDGKPVVKAVTEVAKYHVATPMVDITAIGAGGGSIATVVNGKLRVGPASAGSYPGPVCYGRGGTRVTVTDADVALGVIDPDNFLGGRMAIDKPAAEDAIRAQIAEPLGISVVAAAAGIREIVDARMADTLRELTVGRGHDPRDFVLYAYGGAGPMHCAGFGAELGAPSIVVPATSMAHSAYGALSADIHHGCRAIGVAAQLAGRHRAVGGVRPVAHQGDLQGVGGGGTGQARRRRRRRCGRRDRPVRRHALPQSDPRTDHPGHRRSLRPGLSARPGAALRAHLRGDLRQGIGFPGGRDRADHLPGGRHRTHGQAVLPGLRTHLRRRRPDPARVRRTGR